MDNADLVSIRRKLLPHSSLDPSVALLDLARLHLKLRDVSEGEGWPAEVCALAELEYRRFLTLKRFFFSTSLVPNCLIDKFWHAHILDTRNYHSDCSRLFGEYLHHYPYFGKRGEFDRLELARAFQKTKDLYLGIFGESMDKAPSDAARILSKRGTPHPMLAEPSFLEH
jgi:hypothetical protein